MEGGNDREDLIKRYMGLVEILACKYDTSLSCMEKEDLIQEGYLGLIAAIDTYDSSKGSLFNYIVTLVSRKFVEAFASNEGVFKVGYKMYRLLRVCRSFEMMNARPPTHEEFAGIVKSVGITYVNAAIVFNRIAVIPKKCDCGTDFIENIGDKYYVVGFNSDKRLEFIAAKDLINKLSGRERLVMAMYYGIGYDGCHTLEEIADVLKVSVSMVGNIKGACIKKLRSMLDGVDVSGLV